VSNWRVGDVVVVRECLRVTNLGEGRIIDIETYDGTNSPKSALVRFEHGTAAGIWYSVGTLQKLGDVCYSVVVSEVEPEVEPGPVVVPRPASTYGQISFDDPSAVFRMLAAALSQLEDASDEDDEDEFLIDF